MNDFDNESEIRDLEIVNPPRIAMVVATVLAIGMVFYHTTEKLSWLDSLYFCVVTLTTVGYGDIVPHTDAGKLFTVFYILIGVGIIATSLSYLVKNAAKKRLDRKR